MKEKFTAHLINGKSLIFLGHETDITESKTQFTQLVNQNDEKLWLNINNVLYIEKTGIPQVTTF